MPKLEEVSEGIWFAIAPSLVAAVDGYTTEHDENDPRTKGFRNLYTRLHALEHVLRSLRYSLCKRKPAVCDFGCE